MGYKVKEVRESKGITQEDLSEKSGVSRATISSIENDAGCRNVTLDTLRKIARALDKTVDEIFFDESV